MNITSHRKAPKGPNKKANIRLQKKYGIGSRFTIFSMSVTLSGPESDISLKKRT